MLTQAFSAHGALGVSLLDEDGVNFRQKLKQTETLTEATIIGAVEIGKVASATGSGL